MSLHLTDLGPLLENLPRRSTPLSIDHQHLTYTSSSSHQISLPDELIQAILQRVCAFPPQTAHQTLLNATLVSRQWQRVIKPILHKSPLIDMGTRSIAQNFLSRVSTEMIEHQLDLMNFKIDKSPPSHSLIGRMRKLIFIGQPLWRHRASVNSRPDLVDRSTLHEILNRLWATDIHTLVFDELPFSNPFYRTIVNRSPSSLTTVIMLTPLSPFQLLFFLRELTSLRHLCIGSRDDTASQPAAEHQTLFSQNQLPTSQLNSFGIAARTSERWLKTGLPWLENILNLILVPSRHTLKTVHLELADDSDERHLISILGSPLPDPSTNTDDLNTPRHSPTPESSQHRSLSSESELEVVYLRGISSQLMAHTLSRCQGIRRLCLSSIYGTALRSSSIAPESQPLITTTPSDPSHDISTTTEVLPTPLALLQGRSVATKNPVWSSIPSSVQELSIDITRLPGHGPWNARSAGQLALTLGQLIASHQCPQLIRLGSVFGEESFKYGIYPHLHDSELISPVEQLLKLAKANGIQLVPSFWSDSFVPSSEAGGWFTV